MCHGNHPGFAHRRMAHQRVLQINRADPLAAGLYQVLAAIHQLDAAIRIDRGNVPSAEPAVFGPAIKRSRRVKVTTRYPRSADLEFAHGAAVARCLALVIADTHIDERQRPALLGPHRVLTVFGPGKRFRPQPRNRCLRRSLRHTPGMNEVEAMSIKIADQALRRRSATAQYANVTRGPPLRSTLLQVRQYA